MVCYPQHSSVCIIDECLKRLETDGIGCWRGKQYYGCLCYEDDLTLVVLSVSGLRKMVETCERDLGENIT